MEIQEPYVHELDTYPFLGKFSERDLPDYSARSFEERGFTVGIGG